MRMAAKQICLNSHEKQHLKHLQTHSSIDQISERCEKKNTSLNVSRKWDWVPEIKPKYRITNGFFWKWFLTTLRSLELSNITSCTWLCVPFKWSRQVITEWLYVVRLYYSVAIAFMRNEMLHRLRKEKWNVMRHGFTSTNPMGFAMCVILKNSIAIKTNWKWRSIGRGATNQFSVEFNPHL